MNNIDARLAHVSYGRAFLQQQIFQTLGRARAGAEPAMPAGLVDSAGSTIAAALRDSLGDAIGAPAKSAARYAVHDVAQALRAALESSGGAGKTVDNLLERLDAGFAEARRRLEQAGFDAASIDASIAAFRDRLADLLAAFARGVDRPPASPAAGPAPTAATVDAAAPLAATATRASYVRKESLRLEVLTQEGDVVSLKIRNKDVMQASGASAVWADAAATQGRVDVVSTSKVRIEVQGNLNDAELAAIQDLAAQADAIAERFFAGDVAAAFEAGAALDLDGSQIAAAGLRLAVRERFTLQQTATGTPAATVAAPARSPLAPPQASTAPPPPTAAANAEPPAPAPVAESTAATQPAAAAPARAEIADRLGAQIASLLAWAQAPTDAGRLEIRMQFKLRLVATLTELATPAAPSAGAALRQDTLRQLTSPERTSAG